MKRNHIETFSEEEVEAIADSLRERLNEHDENRIRVQEKLDKVCSMLRSQLEAMESNVNENLEGNFKNEDATMQETLSGILELSGPNEEKDDAQRAKLAQLIRRAKAILLVKQSYELRKPKKTKQNVDAEQKKHRENFGNGGGAGGLFGRGGHDFYGNVREEKNNNNNGNEEEEKDPDLSNLYELDVKSEIAAERLCVRKPLDLEIAKVSNGRVYLSFTKSFNAEEESILSDHGLKDGIAYRAAIRNEGSDEWTEHDLTAEAGGGRALLLRAGPVLGRDHLC